MKMGFNEYELNKIVLTKVDSPYLLAKTLARNLQKKAKSRLKKKLSISSNQDIVLYLEQYL
jgi:hypothetical protein